MLILGTYWQILAGMGAKVLTVRFLSNIHERQLMGFLVEAEISQSAQWFQN